MYCAAAGGSGRHVPCGADGRGNVVTKPAACAHLVLSHITGAAAAEEAAAVKPRVCVSAQRYVHSSGRNARHPAYLRSRRKPFCQARTSRLSCHSYAQGYVKRLTRGGRWECCLPASRLPIKSKRPPRRCRAVASSPHCSQMSLHRARTLPRMVRQRRAPGTDRSSLDRALRFSHSNLKFVSCSS